MSKGQALELVRELEGAKLGELDHRLKKVRAQLCATSSLRFEEALDSLLSTGSYESALVFSSMVPFLQEVPRSIISKLGVELEGVNGWQVMKSLPFNRRFRKRLHGSHDWVVRVSSTASDPLLQQLCQQRGLELVELSATNEGIGNPDIWKAISWAAFTGRVVGLIADAPMRTWMSIHTSEKEAIRFRTTQYPWGVPRTPTKVQERIDSDTLVALQPLWLWTLASLSRGEGVPLCQAQAMSEDGSALVWAEKVLSPFQEWSNCSRFVVPGVKERGRQTRPLEVCSNLRFPPEGCDPAVVVPDASSVPRSSVWPLRFTREVTLGLFGYSTALDPEHPRVEAVRPDVIPDGEVPVGSRAGLPAEVPVGSRAGLPAEVPVGSRAGLPAEVPEGSHAGLPAEVPVGSRAGLPAEVPEGSHAGLPAEVPVGSHAGLPAEVPVGSRAGLPAEVPEGSHAGLPAEVPEGSRAGLPAEVPEGLCVGMPAGGSESIPEGQVRAAQDNGSQAVAAAPAPEALGSGGERKPEVPVVTGGERLSAKERERWRRHIAAHHLPFRKDCLQCVMSGALGLQHRRVKCPHMYALSFDLTGPFQEKGIDDRGGGYKYALVAGLRVPEVALPSEVPKAKADVGVKEPEVSCEVPETDGPLPADPDLEDIEWSGSEVSWLEADATAKPDDPQEEGEAPEPASDVDLEERMDQLEAVLFLTEREISWKLPQVP